MADTDDGISSSDERGAVSGPTADEKHFLVAIGAFAGGLDALERLFRRLPADTGATFVVIQHLSPEHKSMMGALRARHTEMPVVTVEDDMRLTAHLTSQPIQIAESAVPRVLDYEGSGEPISGIMHLLSRAGGINFEDYKPGTVNRRIERRMSVRQAADLEGY